VVPDIKAKFKTITTAMRRLRKAHKASRNIFIGLKQKFLKLLFAK